MSVGTVIVGAGQAGGWVALELRRLGYPYPVTLVGAESHVPYERPPLSKALLLGRAEPESTWLHPEQDYRDADIVLCLGCEVVRVASDERQVELADGSRLPFATLVFCTGGAVIQPDLPGIELSGVHFLRDLEDSLLLRQTLAERPQLVVVGGGFIGLEVAAAARELGAEVVVLERAGRILERAVDVEIATEIADRHRQAGVDLRCGVEVVGLAGSYRVEGVCLADGTTVPADAVVIGIGIRPSTALAQGAGVDIDDGIRVDARGATTISGIYAAGDCTNHFNPRYGRHMRLESWQNAQNQALVVAANIAGQSTEYRDIPWFWSDQYDLNLQLLGVAADADTAVTRQGDKPGSRMKFYLDSGRLCAVAAIDSPRAVGMSKRIIDRGVAVTRGDFEAEPLDLKALMKRPVEPVE